MAKSNGEEKANNLQTIANPQTSPEFVESGWMHYSKKEYFRAEADFKKALDLSGDDPDTLYALALTYQASGRKQDAVRAFERVVDLLKSAPEEDVVRSHMLARLANAHINRIKTGDWQMEA